MWDELKFNIIGRNNFSNEDSDFVKVLNFNSNQDFFVFYKDETGK